MKRPERSTRGMQQGPERARGRAGGRVAMDAIELKRQIIGRGHWTLCRPEWRDTRPSARVQCWDGRREGEGRGERDREGWREGTGKRGIGQRGSKEDRVKDPQKRRRIREIRVRKGMITLTIGSIQHTHTHTVCNLFFSSLHG